MDLIHGYSSHHRKAIEVYKDKLILYGCGDLLNDYEGIGGYEEFRSQQRNNRRWSQPDAFEVGAFMSRLRACIRPFHAGHTFC